VEEEDRDAQQHRAQARRLANELNADAHRADEPLLPERARPVLVAPEQDEEARQEREDGVEREHPDAPALAISAPARSGPTMRDRFIATPLRASDDASWSFGTSSGTIAENTGQRSARPMPLAKTSTSSRGVVMSPSAVTAHEDDRRRGEPELRRHQPAAPVEDVGERAARQAEQEHRQRRRGLDERDPDRRARQRGHRPCGATSVIHMHRLAVSQVLQSRRKTGMRSGSSAVTERSDTALREGGGISGGVVASDRGGGRRCAPRWMATR
jgi:hypothetical protein